MRRKFGWLLAAGAVLSAISAIPPSAGAAGLIANTQIQHVVVIYQENASFDHLFGTYPKAGNTDGTPFRAAPGTPSVNGLTPALLSANPNSANPFRLSRAQALTCDQDHEYSAEQQAFDNGLMDKFVQFTNTPTCTTPGAYANPNLVMGYYDGNSVTGLWNLAQHNAMSDAFYDTTFGPSTPGALNLVAGQTHGTQPATAKYSLGGEPYVENGTAINDGDPSGDDCSASSGTYSLTGTGAAGTVPYTLPTGAGTAQGNPLPSSGKADQTIGDTLSAKGLSWGWFEGGFAPTAVSSAGIATCGSFHYNEAGNKVADYSAHHEPFQYFPQWLNEHHVAPSSPQQIGYDDPSSTPVGTRVNHQYDLSAFWTAVQNNDMPAVSYLKAPRYQDGHPGNSDVLDEQKFLADTIDQLEQSPEWAHTAVFVTYDDSDGWYDHSYTAPINSSHDTNRSGTTAGVSVDNLNGNGNCGNNAPTLASYPDRCGYGARLPMLLISPWAKTNYVDHTINDFTSILRFIEHNWSLSSLGDGSFDAAGTGDLMSMFDFNASHPRNRPIYLDDQTGQVIPGPGAPGPTGPTGPTGSKGPKGRPGHAGRDAGTILCRITTKHHKIHVTCHETGGKVRKHVRVSVTRGDIIYASGAAKVKGHVLSATLQIRHHRHVTPGAYQVSVKSPGQRPRSVVTALT